MSDEIKNAIIESTHLGYEDHGILTAYLHLKGDGWGQAFGGYGLDGGGTKDKPYQRVPVPAMGYFVERVLWVVGVDAWEKIAGKHVRMVASHTKVHRIGHFLEDRWFDPDDMQTQMEAVWVRAHSDSVARYGRA